ncbi:hypothetical protein JCM9140_4415 [Halalkalibacter wakoensis JCM 9140]|uniref:DUF2382 domain-containing protein n=1 Tax=Halalkalibacter wakoensis JCM 9140 TaxID=1236970 RepID=W4Q8A0_9BACI|nr:YsnF/AvaK domain-containing protein [Halalkalibacter wakoensis]GAE28205.1 hypothetical protein JCM9140_4415 [Halalkalibacter wakoensis JCM 9140]
MGKHILIGAAVGLLVAWLLNVNILAGLIIGGAFGSIIRILLEKRTEPSETLRLHEEELDITKKRVQTGEVKIHHEVVDDQKTITIPIKRQEMVIEAANEEELRIPIKEEEIEIRKRPVKVNEVSVSKHQIEKIETITEKLKKEVADVEVKGEADIIKNGDN